MTPMIDVVFLLIIFFLAVSQSTRATQAMIVVPTVFFGDPQSETKPFLIQIDSQGNCRLQGERTSNHKLESAINSFSEFKHSDRQVVLRCDRKCPSQFVNQILRVLNQNGIHSIQTIVVED